MAAAGEPGAAKWEGFGNGNGLRVWPTLHHPAETPNPAFHPAETPNPAATVSGALTVFGGRRHCEPFLSPAEVGDADAEPSFTVIWTARSPRKVIAFAFSSRGERWRALPSLDCFVWRRHRSPFSCPINAVWNRRHYAHGRFYWVDCFPAGRWLVLDARTMELAVVVIPSPAGFWEEHVAVVEGQDGKVGMFAHDFYHADGKAKLHYCTIEQDGEDGDAPRWQLQKTIPLPWPTAHGRPFCVRGTANGCLILEVSDEKPAFMASYRNRDAELFKIDVKNFQVERICKARRAGECCWPYFGFPPFLSLPTV
ncbi:uncharacterized protein LOC133923224 [Phragmites australis]|uniref:uncharacterized protein LOC133923224 n=1 Tax=Phragmites australis TaxID=29695 RepID=UPI002D781AA2|nr:uncharacterized protein LOC133923224 [Phragmites australis]